MYFTPSAAHFCTPSGVSVNTPSDFFRRNVFVSFQEDDTALRLPDVIGRGNLVWGSDYPHHESTFPLSRKILAEMLAGIDDGDVRTILEQTPNDLYRFG